MISRRSVSLAGGIGLLLAQRFSRGQAGATMRRVGILQIGSEAGIAARYAAFKQGMHEFGWLEGKNVEYRFASAEGDVNRLDVLARELVEQKVDLILVAGTPATRAAQRATKTLPIVMGSVGDPVGNGFVVSLARPGGNISGISNQTEEVLGKLIGILHEVVPGARRIAILLNENTPSHAVIWATAQSACATLNLVVLRVVASAPAQFGAAVKQIARQRAQAVVVPADSMYLGERAKLQELMQTTRLPVAYGLREHVDAGGGCSATQRTYARTGATRRNTSTRF